MRKTSKIAILAVIFSLISLTPAVFAQNDPDVVEPSDVENVSAIGGDSEIMLTWNQATDNVGVTGYKIYYGTNPVSDSGDDYNLPVIEVEGGSTTQHKLTGLENGTSYYFALTAIDAAGNESEYYSEEVNATPTAVADGQEDTVAPSVISVQALSSTEVSVVFSEPVVIPETAPEKAFIIKNQSNNADLVIISATTDAEGKQVTLITEPQENAATYLITAGIEIEDKAGNQIESGLSDTATFTGISDEEAPVDMEKPKVTSARALSSVKVQVEFSEEIILSENPVENFKIYQNIDETLTVPVYSVEVEPDGKIVVLTTEIQDAQIDYVVEVVNVADKSGNVIQEGFDNMASFMSTAADLVDIIPPEEVTNFIASLVQQTVVTLKWTASINSAGDLAEYILYMSQDKGETYNKVKRIPKETTSYKVEGLKPDTEYAFKLTATDQSGNESNGVITMVKTLPQTGPAVYLLLISALGAAGIAFKKKK